MIQVDFEKNFNSWRDQARNFLAEGIRPDQINWSQDELSLFTLAAHSQDLKKTTLNQDFKVPPELLSHLKTVSYARDEDRWNLMYKILFRLCYENKDLLSISIDPDINKAEKLQKSVRQDIHKMHAFVRFKKSFVEDQEVYVAWHKPEHLIVRPGTEFFARRYGDKRWSIFTPDESAHWDLKKIIYGSGMAQRDFQGVDEWDEIWKTYYKSIFNPARIKIKMMKSEMSPKYWSSMPETALIRDLVREAPRTLQKMAENINTSAVVDLKLSLPELKIKAMACQACPLYARATKQFSVTVRKMPTS